MDVESWHMMPLNLVLAWNKGVPSPHHQGRQARESAENSQ